MGDVTLEPLGCQRCDWVPRWTDAKPHERWPTRGPLACGWVERYCILGEGDYFGKLMQLRKSQAGFLYDWYEHCPECGQWRYNEGLKLAAKGDGKTQLISALAVLDMAGPEGIASPSANVQIAAASFGQAKLLFGAVSIICGGQNRSVRESPLRHLFEVYDSYIKFADGRPGIINRVATVGGTNDGGLPSLLLGDELHEWGASVSEGGRKARVYTVIKNSAFKRTLPGGSGRVMGLSTVGGQQQGTLLGELYDLALRAQADPSVAPRFYLNLQQARPGLDYDNPDDRLTAVKDASDAADVLWSAKDRVALWGHPAHPKHEWMRYFANIWPAGAEDSWLSEQPMAWSNNRGEWESNDENPFVVAVDMALKRDSVAVSRIEQLPDDHPDRPGKIAVTSRFWVPKDGEALDHADVFAHIRWIAKGTGFRGVVYDPRFFELPARMLEDDGIETIRFDQQATVMAPAVGLTYDLIVSGQIVHDGNPVLADHVMSAARREAERGFTLSKGKSKRHIDGAITLCMGAWALRAMQKKKLQPLFAVRAR